MVQIECIPSQCAQLLLHSHALLSVPKNRFEMIGCNDADEHQQEMNARAPAASTPLSPGLSEDSASSSDEAFMTQLQLDIDACIARPSAHAMTKSPPQQTQPAAQGKHSLANNHTTNGSAIGMIRAMHVQGI